MKKILLNLLLLASLLFLPIGVQASMLDFSIFAPQPLNSTISYAGGSAPLIGSRIAVASVVGIDTPLFNGVSLAITDGVLNFNTGSYSPGGTGSWTFGGGSGSLIELWGKIPSLGIDTLTKLMWGSGSVGGVVTPLGSTFKVAILSFTDEKNATLKNYYGLSNQYFEGNLNLSFLASGATPNAFTSTKVLSGDVLNQVPIPAAAWLLATGLIGLVGVRRRFVK